MRIVGKHAWRISPQEIKYLKQTDDKKDVIDVCDVK